MPITRSKAKKEAEKIEAEKKEVEKKVAVKKKTPIFTEGNVKATGIRYQNKDLYAYAVKTNKATYEDMYKYVDEKKKKLAAIYPEMRMNVAIKYDGMSTPISAGFFSVLESTELKAPYDYSDDGSISEFFISFTGE